jgi:hypothetical protein
VTYQLVEQEALACAVNTRNGNDYHWAFHGCKQFCTLLTNDEHLAIMLDERYGTLHSSAASVSFSKLTTLFLARDPDCVYGSLTKKTQLRLLKIPLWHILGLPLRL